MWMSTAACCAGGANGRICVKRRTISAAQALLPTLVVGSRNHHARSARYRSQNSVFGSLVGEGDTVGVGGSGAVAVGSGGRWYFTKSGSLLPCSVKMPGTL